MVRRQQQRVGAELLQLAVDRLLAEDPLALPGGQALERLRVLLGARERLQAATLRAVRDADVRDLCALDGAGSARGWLRTQLTGEDGQLGLARALDTRPRVAQALADGRLSVRSAALVCATLERVPAEVAEEVLHAVLRDGVGAILTAAEGGTPDDGESVELLTRRREAARVLAECCAMTAAPAVRLEPAWVLLAERLTPNLLGSALRQLLEAVLPDGSDGDDSDPYYVELRPLYDGDWDLRGLLDPATGQSLAAELDRRRHARTTTDGDGHADGDTAPADLLGLFDDPAPDAEPADDADAADDLDAPEGAPLDDARDTPLDDVDSTDDVDPAEAFIAELHDAADLDPGRRGSVLTAGRLRHDALAQLLCDAREARAGSGSPAPTALTVVASLDAVLARPGALPAQLASPGRPPVLLPTETLQRLGCHSTLAAVLLDAAGNPVGASSTRRSANRRERRALRARWGATCAVRGCPSTSTVPHHAEPWWRVRRTRLCDLVPLCEHCHRDLHEGHRTLRLRDGRLIDEHGWATGRRQTTTAA